MANLASKVEGTGQRRWRTNNEVVRKVVSIADILKKRELKALDKQQAVLEIKPEAPKFEENYFQEAKHETEPQKITSVVNKMKWGKKQ